ncbi:MAG TPA: hypothetical protein VK610_06290 [Rhodothermales bacterium]|nr:hypothetical protein [Rhodothermales bacterium]
MARLLLATPLPAPLADEGGALVEYLRGPSGTTEKGDRAFRFIYAVGEHALTYHFNEPLASIGVGMVLRKTVSVALQVALAGLRGPLRHVLTGMDDAQLRRVADEVEFRLYPDPHAAEP